MKWLLALCAVFLIWPFHHHPAKPSPLIQHYVAQATFNVQSYDDGSFNAAIEHDEIVQIELDIYQLSQINQVGPESDALVEKINSELSSLSAEDKLLSETSSL